MWHNTSEQNDIIRDNSKQFNTDSYELIQDIESIIKADFANKLQKKYGEKWLTIAGNTSASYSFSEEEYLFLKAVHSWLSTRSE